MATSTIPGTDSPLLVVGDTGGITVIDPSTPLKRLNYFDGKLLRADDFTVEQDYLRQLVALSNQGLGPGVVYGFDTTLGSGDSIQIGPGLAIDPSGRVLLMQSSIRPGIGALIEASRRTVTTPPDASGKTGAGAFGDCLEVAAPPPPTVVAPVSNLYVIAICAAEALCGAQDVYGRLCEEGCVTSTDRPYRLDGVVVRAIPLQVVTPFPTSRAVAIDASRYLRSKLAHSWYQDEARKHPHAVSREGLLSHVWCLGAGYSSGCCEVPLAVVARSGATTVFLDAWIVRRERMEAPARRYWQWKMLMRPWDVFLAQVLQFQCHLADVLAGLTVPGSPDQDPCAPQSRALGEAAQFVEQVRSGLSSYRKVTTRAAAAERPALLSLSLANVTDLRDRLQQLVQRGPAVATDRVLISGGVIETPSAGYLPVLTGSSVTVNQQVRALLGDGVDLRFCIVRPDVVAHALEEAQHMERISLIEGLDDPQAKPAVDVLVPNGQLAANVTATGALYEMRLNVLPQNLVLLAAAFAARQANTAGGPRLVRFDSSVAAMLARASEGLETFEYSGAGHGEQSPAGRIGFQYAGITGTFTLGPDRPQPAPAPAPAPAPVPGTPGRIVITDREPAAVRQPLGGLRAMAGSRQPQVRSSVWIATEIAADPAGRARGESVQVTFEQMVLLTSDAAPNPDTGATATQTILLRAGFTGEFQVERNEARPGTAEVREVDGVLAGELALSYRQQRGTELDTDHLSLYLSENVRILRTMGPYGAAYRIEMPQPTLFAPLVTELEARREWKSATRAEAAGTMTIVMGGEQDGLTTKRGKQTTRQGFTAWQTINAAVREPNHPAHESAIRALRSIGGALGAGKFADLAARRLFPAAPPAGSDPQIYASLDWVLFHRRRDRRCHGDTPAVTVDTRRYALYHARLTGDQTVADLAKRLQRAGARGEGLPALDFIQLVEFEAGIHAVASPHAQVQASWRQDVGDGTVQGGVIASRGVAVSEGERLARERVEALVDVVGAVAPVGPRPDYAVLTRVPDALDVPGNDGVVVVATSIPAITNCQDVVGVPREEDLKALVEGAQAGRLEDAINASKTARRLGTVTFTSAVPDAAALAAVKDGWTAMNAGAAAHAVVIARAVDAGSANYLPQAAAIVAALGGQGTPPLVTTQPAMAGCPAMTIVAGSVAVRNALMVYGNFDIENGSLRVDQPANVAATLEFRNNVPQGAALQNYVNALGPNRPVNVVMLTTTAALDAGAPARAAAAAAPLVKPTGFRAFAKALTPAMRDDLRRNNQDPAPFDDVVFFSAVNLNQPDQ